MIDLPQLANSPVTLFSRKMEIVRGECRGFHVVQCHRTEPELIDRIGKTGASFRSLGDPLWDTGSAQGRLLSTFLAAIAEFERELIRERTGEGRKRAMANGVKLDRKSVV